MSNRTRRPLGRWGLAALTSLALTLAACGGGGGDPSPPADGGNTGGGNTGGGGGSGGGGSGGGGGGGGTPQKMTALDANRLAHQATFGPTEALLVQMQTQTAEAWVREQMALKTSRYSSGGGNAIHTSTDSRFFCDIPQYAGDNCWRDWFSTEPLVWDFYRNATTQPDQLRQRVAWALSQWLVVSSNSISGTYGFRQWHNMLLDQAFGNYRDVLKKVSLSPVMGDYLNNANNDPEAPNENFARELLQLFSIGTCKLNADGTLQGGACSPTYDNNVVRNYAYALTGWTYPSGGQTSYGCFPVGANCQFWAGDMVPSASNMRDKAERSLLGGASVPANTGAAPALEAVLDSLMAHANTAPFVARHLIQHLVTSNPSPAYVGRVAQAFTSGRFGSFGNGVKGDLGATVAATLLDGEARSESPARGFGRLREPVQVFTGVIRALGGVTDGSLFGWWLGEALGQHAFMPPSVFNYYPPDFPLPGTALVAPAFGIHNANTALTRYNFLALVLQQWGDYKDASVPGATGTTVNYDALRADASDPARLVDRLAVLAHGRALSGTARTKVIEAVAVLTNNTAGPEWLEHRLRTAAYLVFAAPQYHVVR